MSNSIQESARAAVYEDTAVRQFSIMAVVWGVVGMLVGSRLPALGFGLVPVMAFAGALGAMVLVVRLAGVGGRLPVVTVLLAGFAVIDHQGGIALLRGDVVHHPLAVIGNSFGAYALPGVIHVVVQRLFGRLLGVGNKRQQAGCGKQYIFQKHEKIGRAQYTQPLIFYKIKWG